MKTVDPDRQLYAVFNWHGEPLAIVGAENIAQELADYWSEELGIARTDKAYAAGEIWIDADVTKRFST